MAEVIRRDDDHNSTRTLNSKVAVMALIVAVLALVFAWAAYNRAGEDLEDQAIQGIEQGAEDAGDAVENAAEEAGEAVQDGTDAVERGIDTGPDGVDDGAQ